MNANEVLIDLLEDNRRRVKRTLGPMAEACLYWQPDAETNSIALTLWHMARLFDVFLVRQAQGLAAEEECWFKGGWQARTGYDPRGLGMNGWGALTGYTLEQAAAVPRFGREQLLGYFEQVYDAVRAYLEATPMDRLQEQAGRYTRYQHVQMALMDNVRHLGEIFALQRRWERAL